LIGSGLLAESAFRVGIDTAPGAVEVVTDCPDVVGAVSPGVVVEDAAVVVETCDAGSEVAGSAVGTAGAQDVSANPRAPTPMIPLMFLLVTYLFLCDGCEGTVKGI